MTTDAELIKMSEDVMVHSYSPYSKFPVGAALLGKDGRVFVGVNVENASFGGTICAERSAFVSAVTAGCQDFQAIAISTNMSEPAAPCGLCRQFMVEFGNFKVILNSASQKSQQYYELKDLLPRAFSPRSLDDYKEESSKKNGNH
uniref:Cytidine deaminase n=1 Tax=Rhabditophanes sp. KR3021 TaxID=114890 RepID=A0AC35TK13_9BILA